MGILVFGDTETTGKIPKYAVSSNLSIMPHMVELGAISVDEESLEVIREINVLIKPDGWTIPEEATNIHGISQEMAEKDGVPIEDVMPEFYEMLKPKNDFIAFNVDFDAKILSASFWRAKASRDHIYGVRRNLKCIMKAATPICKIPSPYRWAKDYKWPRLEEAYEIFFKEKPEVAHRAIDDIRNSIKVYKYLRDNGHIPAV